jgi:hypothetical protein
MDRQIGWLGAFECLSGVDAYLAMPRSSAALGLKAAARRQRRAEDTRRWRERLRRGACVLPVEADGMTFDLMERFGLLKASKVSDRQAVAVALGKLLRLALAALLREAASRR